MADLKCGAVNCAYNSDKYCCKGDIMVGGCCADTSCDTCCESFREKNENTYKSSMDHPSRTISIDCEAVKCVYNSNYKCVAEHVDITGAGAASSSGTECSTFTER
ncbi:MAG: DUF1540 domain-containing protein [Lachnospiraceae bacterium]